MPLETLRLTLPFTWWENCVPKLTRLQKGTSRSAELQFLDRVLAQEVKPTFYRSLNHHGWPRLSGTTPLSQEVCMLWRYDREKTDHVIVP